MIRLFAILAALVCTVSLATGVQAQTSKLRKLDSELDAMAWQAVGRLDVAGSGFCSATLIEDDLIVTAAHCVYDMATSKPHAPERMTFRAGLRDGKAAAHVRVSKVAAHPGFDPTSGSSQANVSHDAALLRLERPVQVYQLNPFALHKDRVVEGPVSIVSYGRGRAEAQSRQRECQMTERQGAMLVFDCDVTFGSSGSPVFSHMNGRAKVMAVVSAMSVWNGRKVALGVDVQAVVPELKQMLRASQLAVAPAPRAKVRRLRVGDSTGGGRSSIGAKFVRP
jgi:protease YdgD